MQRVYLTAFKANVTAAAATIKAYRKEERKVLAYARYQKRSNPEEGTSEDSYRAYSSLREKRVGLLRSNARVLNIAYGYLRGKEYLEVENSTREPIPYDTQMSVAYEVFQLMVSVEKPKSIGDFFSSNWGGIENDIHKWFQAGT